jgi:hypothetical protein
MGVALIGGRNFTHKDIIFNLGGVPLNSMSDISIGEGAKREFTWGTGSLPYGYGEGPDDPVSFTFTLNQTDTMSLRRAVGDIKRLNPFDVPVTFANPSNPAGVTIKNVLIQKIDQDSTSENTDIKVKFTAQATHLVWK